MRLASGVKLPLPIPIEMDLTPDWRALVFALFATFTAGLAFGLVPAWRSTKTDLGTTLKEAGRPRPSKHRRMNLRKALVLAQVAASLALLLLAGYLGYGIQSTLGAQEGFDPRNLYMVSLDPVRDGYPGPRAADFLEKLLERTRRLPGVFFRLPHRHLACCHGREPRSALLRDRLERGGDGFERVGAETRGGPRLFRNGGHPNGGRARLRQAG